MHLAITTSFLPVYFEPHNRLLPLLDHSTSHVDDTRYSVYSSLSPCLAERTWEDRPCELLFSAHDGDTVTTCVALVNCVLSLMIELAYRPDMMLYLALKSIRAFRLPFVFREK
jgi:hypothetical protein